MSATASPRVWQQAGHHILFDPALLPEPQPAQFDPAWWQAQGAVDGQALGRGTTWFLRVPPQGWVLRHYRRGGLVGRVLEDGYAWLGLQATRARRCTRWACRCRARWRRTFTGVACSTPPT